MRLYNAGSYNLVTYLLVTYLLVTFRVNNAPRFYYTYEFSSSARSFEVGRIHDAWHTHSHQRYASGRERGVFSGDGVNPNSWCARCRPGGRLYDRQAGK